MRKLSVLLGVVAIAVWVTGASAETSPVETHHSGNLELTGTQTLIIENKTYYQDGDIVLSDRAQLILRNATLVMVQAYHEEHNIRVDQSARIELTDATIRSSFDLSTVTLSAKATAKLTRATVEGWLQLYGGGQLDCDSSVLGPSTGGLIIADSYEAAETGSVETAKAHVSDTTIHEFSLAVYSPCSTVISDIRPGNQPTWEFGQQSATAGHVPFDFRFTNVGVEVWDVRLGGSGNHTLRGCTVSQLAVEDTVRVLCSESNIREVVLILDAGTWALSDLQPGLVEALDLDLARTGGPQVRLNNVTIGSGWHLRLRGGQVSVLDSAITRLWPRVDAASSSYILRNCCVDELLPWETHGTVDLENCVLGRIHTPDSASLTLRGAFRISENSSLDAVNGPWRNGATIARYFPVRVIAAGKPIANTIVELRDKEDRLVQSVRTNARGETEFHVTFDEANNADTWTVRVPAGPWSQPLTLLSDTPISLPDSQQGVALPCEQELEASGSSPVQRESQATLAEESWPVWSTVPALQTDPAEQGVAASRDILALKVTSDTQYLFLALELRDSPDPPGTSRYFIYIWGDESRHTCYCFVLDSGTLTKSVDWQSVSESPVPFRITGNMVEIAVPLQLLPPTEGLLVTIEARIWPDVVEDSMDARLAW
jgi:hypothetical protein